MKKMLLTILIALLIIGYLISLIIVFSINDCNKPEKYSTKKQLIECK